MADTGIFATTEEVQRKAGVGASTISNTETYINDFISQAESYINVLCKKNWSDNYAGLNTNVKGILKEAASNLAAIYVLNYDFSSISAITSRAEAEDRVIVLWERLEKCIDILKLEAAKSFIEEA